ncbi:hypothetical protein Tco_0610024 [Tanacetum coccineum]
MHDRRSQHQQDGNIPHQMIQEINRDDDLKECSKIRQEMSIGEMIVDMMFENVYIKEERVKLGKNEHLKRDSEKEESIELQTTISQQLHKIHKPANDDFSQHLSDGEESNHEDASDTEVWKVIQNGNSKKRISTGKDGVVRVLSPVTAAEIQAVEKERKLEEYY